MHFLHVPVNSVVLQQALPLGSPASYKLGSHLLFSTLPQVFNLLVTTTYLLPSSSATYKVCILRKVA